MHAENVQLEKVEIPDYQGELENVPEEKMAETVYCLFTE